MCSDDLDSCIGHLVLRIGLPEMSVFTPPWGGKIESKTGIGIVIMKTVRPSWDQYFLGVAHTVALRSDCRRARVGAVVVDTAHRIVSTGYNGVSAGKPGCSDGLCPRGLLSYAELPTDSLVDNCIAFHAEVNALLCSDRFRHTGGTIYVTKLPCPACQRWSRAAELQEMIYPRWGDIIRLSL